MAKRMQKVAFRWRDAKRWMIDAREGLVKLSSIKMEISIGLCTWRSYWWFVASMFSRRLALQRSLISESWQPNLERRWPQLGSSKTCRQVDVSQGCLPGWVWLGLSLTSKFSSQNRSLRGLPASKLSRAWGSGNDWNTLFFWNTLRIYALKRKEEFHCLLKSFK